MKTKTPTKNNAQNGVFLRKQLTTKGRSLFLQKAPPQISDKVFHYVKSVRIRSFGLYFPAFGLNTKILRISLYSVQKRENTNQKNFEYGHFSRSVQYSITVLIIVTPQKRHCLMRTRMFKNTPEIKNNHGVTQGWSLYIVFEKRSMPVFKIGLSPKGFLFVSTKDRFKNDEKFF